MRLWKITPLIVILIPRAALACATCITSPFGDRTYTWPYWGFLLLPFGLLAVVAGILAYCAGYGPRSVRRWLVARVAAKDDPEIIKETT
jgi:hypothetical protein